MSLAMASSAATRVIKAGYHVIKGDRLIEPDMAPLNMRGIIRKAGIIEEIKEMMKHGMIWTKRIVLSVARWAVLEVKPIHIPNQHKATRFPAVAMVEEQANKSANAS